MRYRYIILFLFLLDVWNASMGQQGDFPRSDTIPFTLTEANNIRIQTILNGQDTLDLMLHTASYSVTLLKDITGDLNSMTWDAVDSTKSWGGEHSTRRSSYNSFSIGNFSWDSVIVWENEYSGPGTDGKFGLNFFEGKWVELNFEQELLVLHSVLPEGISGYEKFALITDRDMLFIEAMIQVGEQEYANSYLFHSGFGGTLLFDDQFVEDTGMGEELEIFDSSELKDSYGNVLKTLKANLPKIALGTSSLTNVPVGFFEGAIGRQKMSVMGGELIKRFNWVLDLEGGYMYFKQNKWMDLPFKEG